MGGEEAGEDGLMLGILFYNGHYAADKTRKIKSSNVILAMNFVFQGFRAA